MIRAILIIHERHWTHDKMVLKWPNFVGRWSVYGKKMSIWAPQHHLRSAWCGRLRWPSPYMIRCDYRDISHGSGCFIIVEISTKNIVLPQFSAICSCFWNLWWAISLRVRGLRGFWKHFACLTFHDESIDILGFVERYREVAQVDISGLKKSEIF